MTFQAWMRDVDDVCMHTFCMSIYDLPDLMFYDAYESGQTPEEFIAETIPDLDALKELVFS